MDTDTLASFPESTPRNETKNPFWKYDYKICQLNKFCKDILALQVSMETSLGYRAETYSHAAINILS